VTTSWRRNPEIDGGSLAFDIEQEGICVGSRAMPPLELPFQLLTETEKQCLRLVHSGLTSKQISARRNVRSDRVDKIIQTARSKLGGLPRHEAARRLVEYELTQGVTAHVEDEVAAATEVQPWGAPSTGLADTTRTPSLSGPERPNDGQLDPPAGRDEPDQAEGAIWHALRHFLFGSDRSLRNELDSLSTFAAISIVGAVAAFAVGGLLSLLILLARIAKSE
jgi:DNA-binding CsgD family transcriptional regulator